MSRPRIERSMLVALTTALDAHDPLAAAHAARVGDLAEAVARRLGWDERRLASLRVGARLHDVGKVAVPAAILRKPGPLDAEELRQIRRHPAAGARLVAATRDGRDALPYVLFHHERWDGSGYPAGIGGDAIPVEARVLAVADAFDAMISLRPYRGPLRPERALEEIDRCAGTQFDPAVASTFVEIWRPRTQAIAAAG